MAGPDWINKIRMKITYYYKDACRIYWRLEFTESKNGNNPEWEVTVLRSLEDHDDPNAYEPKIEE